MDRWVGKVAVVTGASAGIGKAIVENLVQSGLQVVGLARGKSKLQSLSQSLAGKKGKFYAYECDVGNEQSVKDAFGWIKKTLGGIHALINNAGVSVPGAVIDLEAEDIKKVFNINVLGLLYSTQQALRIMRDEKIEGTIININSTLGHKVFTIPGIPLNVYPGSKHAVTGIVEELQHELRDQNLRVRVTSLSPGFVLTEMAKANDFSEEQIKNLVCLQPEDVASAVSYVLSAPQHVQITELTIRPLGEKNYLDAENFRKVFNINVLGLLYCPQQALRIMRDEKIEGTIINVNSIQGHRVDPFPGVTLNVYPGSKHADTGIIDELQHELRDENLRIRMTSISPGCVNTDLATAGNLSEKLKNLVQLKSEDIADAVSYILSTPQRIQISELTIRPLGEKY